ncbi:hypothetical protein [Niabella aurantiaca]|uniref:hypothetical protein n=1 Tax=Niabella aurantiaca TaxID=379900 RepID=UPI0003A5BE5E|nr:hypothetical protein [Niabella aurantiaca]
MKMVQLRAGSFPAKMGLCLLFLAAVFYAFRNATYKIAICHIPPANGWHGNLEITKKWVPILNEAIQVMLSAHEHRHRIQQASEAIRFPVIVNSNNNIIRAGVTDTEARFRIFDLGGKLVDELRIVPSK